MTNPPPSFEEAYARLEQILEKMNGGTPTLAESLKLCEEADKLIASCQTELSLAEQKIELLLKNRSGDLIVSEDGKPAAQEFLPSSEQVLLRKFKDANG